MARVVAIPDTTPGRYSSHTAALPLALNKRQLLHDNKGGRSTCRLRRQPGCRLQAWPCGAAHFRPGRFTLSLRRPDSLWEPPPELPMLKAPPPPMPPPKGLLGTIAPGAAGCCDPKAKAGCWAPNAGCCAAPKAGCCGAPADRDPGQRVSSWVCSQEYQQVPLHMPGHLQTCPLKPHECMLHCAPNVGWLPNPKGGWDAGAAG